jgi:hypothetical protein
MGKDVILFTQSEHTKSSLIPVIREVVPNVGIKTCKTIEQTIHECLKNEQRIGTLFIEYGERFEVLMKKLQALRAQPEKKPEKTILLIDQKGTSEDLLTQYLSIGFSGILTKPFTDETVHQVFRVSERLGALGSIARLKVVTGLKVKSMLEQKGEKIEGESLLQTVRNACERFEHENPGNKIEEIARNYSQLDPVERLSKNVKEMYDGASERVKKLIQESKKTRK